MDHYLSTPGVPLQQQTPAGQKDKNLRQKIGETIADMVKKGVPKKDLAGVEKGMDDKNSPLCIDTLHLYVHNRFYSPTERDLRVTWNNSRLFFERIWQ